MYNYIHYCTDLCYFCINICIRKIEFIIYRDDSDISGVEELDMALNARRHTKYSNSFMDPFEYVK